MKNNKPTRRQFLYDLGSLSVALPFLPSLLTSTAQAQTSTKPPLRVVFIGNRNGQKIGNFFPPNPGTMTLHQTNVYYKKLSDISGPMSPIFGTAWDGLRSKMSLLSGLDLVSEWAGHQIGAMLSCAPGPIDEMQPPNFSWAASIDWIISNSPNFYPTTPLVTALRYNNYDYAFSFSNPTGSKPVLLPYLGSESGVFNQAFASLGGGSTPTTNPAAKRTLAADQAVAVMNALQGSARISSLDKQRLQSHAAAISALKAKYVSPATPASCSKPTMTFFKDSDPRSKMYTNINDIIVTAFSCDITRMACYSLPDFDDSNNDQRWQHDVVSHSLEPAELKSSATLNGWKAERVRDLITKLDRVIEADGSTMLDNTLVIWSSESGESHQPHRRENYPILIAGGKNIGAKLKMGYYVDYRTRDKNGNFLYYASRSDFAPQGRPMNQFFVAVMQALGLQRSEFGKYGKTAGKFGDFTPELIYYKGEYDLYKTNYDDNLPFVFTG